MSYISVKAQLLAEKKKKLQRYKVAKNNRAGIDFTYTCFGGNSVLTKEQYDNAMKLSKKMKNMSAW